MEYTKGKWAVRPVNVVNENGNPLYYDIVSDDKMFASTHKNQYIDDMSDEMQLANAKLIACAPEMLELLIKINNKKTFHQGDFSEIKELIQKATTL